MNNQHLTPDGLLAKHDHPKAQVAFRTASIRRIDGTPDTDLSDYGKPAVSYVLDSIGNILLGSGALLGSTKLAANTSETNNTNLNIKTTENKTISIVELRSFAIAAIAVAIIIALIIILRRKH